MSIVNDLSTKSIYQFPRWPSSSSRSQSILTTKDFHHEIQNLNLDYRTSLSRSDSFSTKRTIQHHIHIPLDTDQISPPPNTPPSHSFDLTMRSSRFLENSSKSRRCYRSIPVRIQSTNLTVPRSSKINEKNFPKHIHEQQKLTRERKQKKQQAQILANKHAENETWFQLKSSLTELKRLATQDLLMNSNASLFNDQEQTFLTEEKIHLDNDDEKKQLNFKSESGLSSSSCGSRYSKYDLNRTNFCTSQNSFTSSRLSRKSPNTYSRFVFEPFLINSKPIHPLFLSHPSNVLVKPKLKPPKSPLYRSRPITTPLTDEKRTQLLISDLSNDDQIQLCPTPLLPIEYEITNSKPSPPPPPPPQAIKRIRAPSTIQLTSTIQLKSQQPRCHSATDLKSTSKTYPRFLILADQEHRIESWYHQYPFIHSDDLLHTFQSKQKQIVSAFFTDDFQTLKTNLTTKTFLQGKSFHIQTDWKKYDLIFISNSIYDQLRTYLQTIINLMKSSGKIIQIYQINHDEDLKRQIKTICKSFQQQHI